MPILALVSCHPPSLSQTCSREAVEASREEEPRPRLVTGAELDAQHLRRRARKRKAPLVVDAGQLQRVTHSRRCGAGDRLRRRHLQPNIRHSAPGKLVKQQSESVCSLRDRFTVPQARILESQRGQQSAHGARVACLSTEQPGGGM